MNSKERGMNPVGPLHDQSTERIFANAETEISCFQVLSTIDEATQGPSVVFEEKGDEEDEKKRQLKKPRCFCETRMPPKWPLFEKCNL